MKNVCNGVVELNDKGDAEIEFPDWFDALNEDFRNRLFVIGAPGPNLILTSENCKLTI
jgi:hypothetical protein